jgi:DNA-binding XRE family transcriptional regulator
MPKLADIRNVRFLNQRELAEKAGISRYTIIRIEAGEVRPYTHTMRAIAEALGVEPGEIDWPAAAASDRSRP